MGVSIGLQCVAIVGYGKKRLKTIGLKSRKALDNAIDCRNNRRK